MIQLLTETIEDLFKIINNLKQKKITKNFIIRANIFFFYQSFDKFVKIHTESTSIFYVRILVFKKNIYLFSLIRKYTAECKNLYVLKLFSFRTKTVF